MTMRGVALAAVLAAAVGCSSSSKAPLSVSAKGTEVTTGAPAPLDLGNGILLDRVRIVVRTLVLEPTHAVAGSGTVPPTCDACCCTSAGGEGVACLDADDDGLTETEREHDGDGDGDSDDDEDIVVGPLLVDLSGATLAGGLDQIFSGKIPEGTYEELEFVIGPITAAEAASDAALEEMAAQNASVIVEGSIDGTPFTFVSDLATAFEIEGHIVVSNGKIANVTLSMNVKHWFGGTGAARYDPTDPAQAASIERAIRAAVHAFEDDDRDGHDDHLGNAHTGDGPCDD